MYLIRSHPMNTSAKIVRAHELHIQNGSNFSIRLNYVLGCCRVAHQSFQVHVFHVIALKPHRYCMLAVRMLYYVVAGAIIEFACYICVVSDMFVCVCNYRVLIMFVHDMAFFVCDIFVALLILSHTVISVSIVLYHRRTD